MAFCPNCGAQVDDGAASCPNCGTAFAPANAPVYSYDTKDHTAEYDPKDISDNKVFAMAAYLLGVVGIIITMLAAQKSPYAMFHARQSLKISVCGALLLVCMIVPILGWLVAAVGAIVLMVVSIIQFFSVCNGKAKEAPVVSSFGFLK